MKLLCCALVFTSLVGAVHAQVPVTIVQDLWDGGGGQVRYESLSDPQTTGKTTLYHHLALGLIPQVDSFGDLASTTLRGSLVSPASGTGVNQIWLRDNFQLGNLQSNQVGHLNVLFDGKFLAGNSSNINQNELAFAHLRLAVNYYDLTGRFHILERNLVLDTYNCGRFQYAGLTCVRGNELFLLQTLDVPLLAGRPYGFEMSLELRANQGWQVDFLNTARTYFDLPSGVTINSDSGVLFSSATPVPEPQAWTLMLGGLALLGFLGRRRLQD